VKRADLVESADLVERARALYADDPIATAQLDAHAARLHDPLRLAVAGMVKAGKSTLLNALLGEQIAPTDAGECTRTITWYRHARSPRITIHLQDGSESRMPVRRDRGRLVLDLGSRSAEEVAWIDVRWPAEYLRSTVLIDTPGIASLTAHASATSRSFLVPDDTSSPADAIIYLLRHVHSSDLNLLEAFRDTAAGSSQTVNALAVLSRADEIGSGRIDSLLSAARIADRYRRDGELRSLALDVLPVAGLLAQGARTLRESEFAAFRAIADLERDARERMLISVDRFVRGGDELAVSSAERRALLARFGMFGVRLGAMLVRGGARTAPDLSERMVQQSGILRLQTFVSTQFRARAAVLKGRAVLHGLEELLRERPVVGGSALAGDVERRILRTHELRELGLLAAMRTSVPMLSAADAVQAQRLIGGSGTDPLVRLGLEDAVSADEVRTRISDLLAHWRSVAASPLATRTTAEQCGVVIRSIEGAASELAADARIRPAADVVTAGGPAQRPRKDAHQQAQREQAHLGQ
jgi:hypothetical protein